MNKVFSSVFFLGAALTAVGTVAQERKVTCWQEGGRQVCGDAMPASAANSARKVYNAQGVLTDAQGRVTYLNPVAQRLTGWQAFDAAGRNVDEVFSLQHPDNDALLASPLRQAIQQDAVADTVRGIVVHRSTGQRFQVEATASPITETIDLALAESSPRRIRTSERNCLARLASAPLSEFATCALCVGLTLVSEMMDACNC